MSIEVGDIVTWRHGVSANSKSMPMGIANCEVLELRACVDGRPIAVIRLPPPFRQFKEVGALVADLEKA